jgi:hypothetical protein
MSIIDWSDPEEMLGLLSDYVRDALQQERDRERVRFLRRLATDIDSLASPASPAKTLARLRRIYESLPESFASDDVLIHVRDCIEELARIVAQS